MLPLREQEKNHEEWLSEVEWTEAIYLRKSSE